ncbi:MAG: sigma-54 dependent transcriptional regulator [Desulfohalobiaceae bacterium]|nr:sigma-54 dependent transcriptional regulator [Desulfohalobiaceae bacterium]
MPAHILVVDDEKNYLLLLDTLLGEQGYRVTSLQDPELARSYLGEADVDILIADMKMPHLSGQDLLEYVREQLPHIPVLIMTGYGSIDGAVEAMKCGAFDYINKPFSNDELLLSVAKAAQMSQAQQENRLLQQSLQEQHGLENVVARSRSMQRVLDLVSRIAPSGSNVLISGEAGTGKELIARSLHFTSERKSGPFIPVHCRSMDSATLERELFGLDKASATGETARERGRLETAHKGSLFLDEVAELSLDTQARLLRVLQEQSLERGEDSTAVEVDVRLLAATNRDLRSAVKEGVFREDLYYRLNVVNIEIPPLRERPEDIPVLAAHFLRRFNREYDGAVSGFSPEAMQALSAFHWPGNVRQLENVVERCVVLAQGGEVSLRDLPADLQDETEQFKSAADMLPTRLNLAETLERIEAALIRRALVQSDFVQVKAAEMLGISKSLLQYKLKKYNISGKTQ